jgi:hypothetical protein
MKKKLSKLMSTIYQLDSMVKLGMTHSEKTAGLAATAMEIGDSLSDDICEMKTAYDNMVMRIEGLEK